MSTAHRHPRPHRWAPGHPADFHAHLDQTRKRTRDSTNVHTRLTSITNAMSNLKQITDKTLGDTKDAINVITRMVQEAGAQANKLDLRYQGPMVAKQIHCACSSHRE
jgi:hypothetical protein